jgi:hypothetical protein
MHQDGVHQNGAAFPTAGTETQALLATALSDDTERRVVLESAAGILRHCPTPLSDPRRVTVLIIGFVQSGKTLSFNTVAALCRDNAYRIVIVIAGTSIPLYNQSRERLLRDLGYSTRPGHRWAHFSNPTVRDVGSVQSVLDSWADPALPVELHQTVLITVMKHAGRIRNLNDMLSQLDVRDSTAIVIDDEADQAGLNIQVNQGRISSTNRAILDLRRALPSHGYLEYTATPQALLLIQIIDSLSPDFAVVLEPGADYVGLADFFANGSRLVATIPQNELPLPQNILRTPPASFVHALAMFFVGVAAGAALGETIGNRSMMVHPSRLRDVHGDYFGWAQAVRRDWLAILEQGTDEPDYRDLTRTILQPAYDDLERTTERLPPFQRIMELMRWSITQTDIIELNAGRGATPNVDWNSRYPFILVGGQAMDRGFTVEGLTVTYMARPLGIGNADTVQQRARFLGYKRRFLGFCRVFLPANMVAAYRAYEQHEADLRAQLVQLTGTDVHIWRRRFILDPGLAPTRRNVLNHALVRGMTGAEWVRQRYPHIDEQATANNRRLIEAFLHGRVFNAQIETHPAVSNFSLAEILRLLLVDYRFPDFGESQRFQRLLLELQSLVDDDASATCDVLQINGGRARTRGTTSTHAVKQLFEGRRASGSTTAYPGDEDARRSGRITVQLHRLDVNDSGIVYPDVPAVAVYLPATVAGQTIVSQPTNVLVD